MVPYKIVSELTPLSPYVKKFSPVKFGSAIKVGIQFKVNRFITFIDSILNITTSIR